MEAVCTTTTPGQDRLQGTRIISGERPQRAQAAGCAAAGLSEMEPGASYLEEKSPFQKAGLNGARVTLVFVGLSVRCPH